MGDGPGRTVRCTKKASKLIWQVLPSTKPSTGGTSSTLAKPQATPEATKSPVSPTPSTSPKTSCSTPPIFTHDFIDPNFVRVVTPIGEQTGSGGVIAVRSYIHPDVALLGKELPILAPTNMTLYSASYYKPPGSSATYQPEYSLYFDAGCGITVKFFHIKGVVGKVASSVPVLPSDSSAGQTVKAVSVLAGEQIGWYKLGETSVAFDFWVDDAAHTNEFIVPKHFAGSNALHSVCPYNFYTPEKKSIWLAKLGAPGSSPIPGTSCGEISQGVPGTADGMWFINPITETDRLTWDGFYQSQIMFSTDASGLIRIGGLNSSGSLSQMMVSSNSPSWAKPSTILVGASHCWATDTQSVSVKVNSQNTISVLVGTGSCATQADPATGKTYYR